MDLCKQTCHTFFVNKQIIVVERSIIEYEKCILDQIKSDPMDFKSLAILSQIQLYYHQDFKSALATIKKALELDQMNIDLRLDIIEIMISQKKGYQKDIISLLEECISLDSNYWRCYYLQSSLASLEDSRNYQIKSLEIALSKQPNNPWIMITLAQIYAKIDALQSKARSFIEKIENNIQKTSVHLVECDSQSQFDVNYFNFELLRKMAETHFLLDNNENAEFYFLKALEMNLKCYLTLSCLSQFQRLHREDFVKSIKYSQEALQYKSDYFQSLFEYAISSVELGENEKFLKAIKLSLNQKKDIQTYNSIAYFFYTENDIEQAIYFSKKCIQRFNSHIYPCLIYIRSSMNLPFPLDQEEYEGVMQKYFYLYCAKQEDDLYNLELISRESNLIYN